MSTGQQNKFKASGNSQRAIRSTGDESGDLREACESVASAVSNYSRKNPTAVALAIFFAGFYVGWKVKPW